MVSVDFVEFSPISATFGTAIMGRGTKSDFTPRGRVVEAAGRLTPSEVCVSRYWSAQPPGPPAYPLNSLRRVRSLRRLVASRNGGSKGNLEEEKSLCQKGGFLFPSFVIV